MIDRIGVIGDIHSQNEPLRASIEILRTKDLPIVCTGDIVDGVGNVHKCIELLLNNRIQTVLGNHDDWMLKNIMREPAETDSVEENTIHTTKLEELSASEEDFMRDLPRTIPLDTACGAVLLCHGVGGNNMNKINPDDYGYAIEVNDDLRRLIAERKYEVLLNGHSHKKMVKEVNGVVIVNAGALTANAGFLIVDFRARMVDFHVLSGKASVGEASVPF